MTVTTLSSGVLNRRFFSVVPKDFVGGARALVPVLVWVTVFIRSAFNLITLQGNFLINSIHHERNAEINHQKGTHQYRQQL